MSRRIARETVMKFLYQFDLLSTSIEDKEVQVDEVFEQINKTPPCVPVHILDEKYVDVQEKEIIEAIKVDDYISGNDEQYIRSILKEIDDKIEEIDNLISKYAKGWKINRIPKVDLAILRLAVFEMKFRDDIPVKVSINESVELAKKFCSSESPAFINAVLGSISRNE